MMTISLEIFHLFDIQVDTGTVITLLHLLESLIIFIDYLSNITWVLFTFITGMTGIRQDWYVCNMSFILTEHQKYRPKTHCNQQLLPPPRRLCFQCCLSFRRITQNFLRNFVEDWGMGRPWPIKSEWSEYRLKGGFLFCFYFFWCIFSRILYFIQILFTDHSKKIKYAHHEMFQQHMLFWADPCKDPDFFFYLI